MSSNIVNNYVKTNSTDTCVNTTLKNVKNTKLNHIFDLNIK